MIKNPVCLVQRSVKTDGKIEVGDFWIHAAKVRFYFGFLMLESGFFQQLKLVYEFIMTLKLI